MDATTSKGSPGPPVLRIVGKKKCGKTTFLERLLPELAALGLAVGTVKHDTHGFEMDREGKDSWRHKRAGAVVAAVCSPDKLALVRSLDREPGLEELARTVFGDLDLVLAEGYFRSPGPKIEVFRPEAHAAPLACVADGLIALVSDADLDLGVPRFGLDQGAQAARFILRVVLGRPACGPPPGLRACSR